VAKWRRRTSVSDLPTGPNKDTKSTTLSIEEEAIIVAFRRHRLLPLDDCLCALQATISSLHRCLQRHEISRITCDGEVATGILQPLEPDAYDTCVRGDKGWRLMD
jgi:hypothetical protein